MKTKAMAPLPVSVSGRDRCATIERGGLKNTCSGGRGDGRGVREGAMHSVSSLPPPPRPRARPRLDRRLETAGQGAAAGRQRMSGPRASRGRGDAQQPRGRGGAQDCVGEVQSRCCFEQALDDPPLLGWLRLASTQARPTRMGRGEDETALTDGKLSIWRYSVG